MNILDNVFGSMPGKLENALDRATTRQSMLTRNIANVNTPGYKRADIDFNIELDDAVSRISGNKRFLSNHKDAQAQRESEATSLRLDGNNVDMEREVFAMAETELRYQTLADMANRYFSGLKNVIREGR
ncbi:MAG: flagellar basal body rod protein FlgB [Armatimonadetes bacterium]|nr:flagellar basal body rod protein FlgB [Armatimonadota bacterium]